MLQFQTGKNWVEIPGEPETGRMEGIFPEQTLEPGEEIRHRGMFRPDQIPEEVFHQAPGAAMRCCICQNFCWNPAACPASG